MKKIITSVFFIIILLITTKVEAKGNVELSVNKNNVDIGEEFTISMHLSNAQVASLTARISVDTSKVEYVSGPGNSNFRNGRIIYTWTDPNGGDSPLTGGIIATFTLIARAGGTAGFSASGDFYAPDESEIDLDFSGATITINQPTTPEPVIEEPENPMPEPTPSVELTPKPTQEIMPTPTETTVIINTPEQSEEPINTPNPNLSNQDEPLSSNTNLKSLRLDVATITPDFASDILQYEAIVSETINNIDVLAVAEDERSTIDITNNNDLQMGNNLIQVTVIAQNGDKKTYNININKTSEADNKNSFLENLAIENATIVPEFSFNEFNYKTELESTQSKVNVLAIPQKEGATVTIQGNEELKFGNNVINILVTSKDGTNTSTYTINAYRKTENEEIEKEKNAIDGNAKNEDLNKELQNKNNTGNFIVIIIIVICTILLIAIVGFLIWKKYKKKNNE